MEGRPVSMPRAEGWPRVAPVAGNLATERTQVNAEAVL
jgi:hypothetical protein